MQVWPSPPAHENSPVWHWRRNPMACGTAYPFAPRRYGMRPNPQQLITSLTRRRLLQGTLGGVAGLTAWPLGWPRLRTAAAQHREPRGQMTWAIQLNIAPTWFDPA